MNNIRVISKEKLLCVSNDYMLYYKDGVISAYDNKSKKIVNKCVIGKGIKAKGLIARLLRSEPRCAAFADKDTCLISHNGRILNYCISTNRIRDEHYYDRGMKNPLSFCVVDNKKTNKRDIYYGEYIWNSNRGPVGVFKRTEGTWEKVFEFKENTITHIHNIVFDTHKEVFYILTGDLNEDSGIWVADKEFNCVEPILLGKQDYRACVAFTIKEGLLYATDTPIEKNYIFKVSINNNQAVEVDTICRLPGPCIYGTKVGDNYVFATSVEPDSTLPSWRYRITRRLGAGVDNRNAHIIIVNDAGEIIRDYKEKKDFWPIWLFQFGNFLFPYNETSKLYATTQALVCGHGCTLLIED